MIVNGFVTDKRQFDVAAPRAERGLVEHVV